MKKPFRTAARVRPKHRPKGWTPERRDRQAEIIRAAQPWLKSTGPKTDEGKARSAANALKHGFRSRAYIERLRQERQLVRDATRTIAVAKLVLEQLSHARQTSDTPSIPTAPTALGQGPAGSEHTGARSGE